MYSHNVFYVILFIGGIFALSFFFVSCDILSSDDDPADVFEDGLSPDLREMIDDEMLRTIEDSLDVPVHRGANPPDIESVLSGAHKVLEFEGVTVVMQPFVLLETNVPDDDEDRLFYNMYVKMGNQDPENYKIDVSMRHAELSGWTGMVDSEIIGDGDSFSIFGNFERERDGETIRTIHVFTGIVTEDGIEEPHLAIMMDTNPGFDDIIPNGTGRSFVDGNGFAEVAEWPEEAAKITEDQPEKFWYLYR